MNSRRSFLRIMGVAPLAAKATADKAIADLAGVSPVSGGFGVPMPSLSGGVAEQSADTWKKKVLRFLAEKTLPAWFEDEIRERNRHVGYLDPDIASKRSWSMNVKIVTQRQRNVERAKRDAIDGPRRGLRSREFEEKYGVWI